MSEEKLERMILESAGREHSTKKCGSHDSHIQGIGEVATD